MSNDWKYWNPGEPMPKGMEWEMANSPNWGPTSKGEPSASISMIAAGEIVYRYRPAKTDVDKCWEAFGRHHGEDGRIVHFVDDPNWGGSIAVTRREFDAIANHIRQWDKEHGR